MRLFTVLLMHVCLCVCVQGKRSNNGDEAAFYVTLIAGIAAGSLACFVVTPLDGK